jgi:hypothetical protein
VSSILLNSPRPINAGIFVVRAFVKMREILIDYRELARKVNDLERKVIGHDDDIRALLTAIRQLMQPTTSSKSKIGFRRDS